MARFDLRGADSLDDVQPIVRDIEPDVIEYLCFGLKIGRMDVLVE